MLIPRGLVLAVLLLAIDAARVGAQQPPAQALPPPLILIVDMQLMLHDAKAAKAVQAVINQQYSVYSKEVAQQEDDLQKGRTELERQRTALAPEVYNERARALQQRYD